MNQNFNEKKDWRENASFAELLEAHGPGKTDKGAEFGHPDELKAQGKFVMPSNPQAKLDLHGCFVAEAESKVRNFIAECRQQGKAFIIVVTGMGRHSEGGESRLRPEVSRILNAMLNEQRIKNYKIAEPRHGGYGALYVYLR